jgi:hypothetical protein
MDKMNIQKNALLVTEVSAAFKGWQFRCASVPMRVPESDVSTEVVFDSHGDALAIEVIQSESKIGSSQRVEEEAFEQTLLYVSSEQCLSPATAPFWLFPVRSVDVDTCKCIIRAEEFNLFKAAGFQMASWCRFFWGNIFFDDSTTPKEHACKASERKLKAGDAIPVRVNGSTNGVVILESETAANEFDATIFVIGKVDFENGSTLDTEREMTVEGVTAKFRSSLGIIAHIHASCSS